MSRQRSMAMTPAPQRAQRWLWCIARGYLDTKWASQTVRKRGYGHEPNSQPLNAPLRNAPAANGTLNRVRGKQRHNTETDARSHAAALWFTQRDRVEPYVCSNCGYWHVGHLPKETT
jgi:hypothetical protein